VNPASHAHKTFPRTGSLRALQRLRKPMAFGMVLLTFSQAVAGDILRGGVPANQQRAAGNSALTSAAADQARVNARDALARTTRAIASVQAMQNAARNLAVKNVNNLGLDPNHPGAQLPVVQDGLTPGGLDIIGTPRGAKAPAQAIVDSHANVTVKQTAQQAFLTWKTFNVGRNTTVTFDQSAGGASAGEWIAFNEIKDPSGSPSQILGQIKAAGQVYVINQNGIIFGGTSQVNVHTLVASSLPIDGNLTGNGLLNNPDVQFLFSALPQAAGSKGTPAFTPNAPLTPDGSTGAVTVQAGAQLTAPTTADHVGGRIALIGANVSNAGTISTPDGQTILAAGLQVGLTAHSSTDPSLRGLDVYVGAVVDPASSLPAYAGTVTNTGMVNALRADVTMTGKTVNQMGVIDSSTSVSLNGRIDLDANYGAVSNTVYDPTIPSQGLPFLFKSAGVVTLGADSVTRILPELSSIERVVGTSLALPSQINVQGYVVHLASNASVLAPNAKVTINTGVWDQVKAATGALQSTFVHSSGQVYLDTGAMINVAGTTDVSAPISENILTLQLRGAEFADSPLNRNNLTVRGVNLTIDVRMQGMFNGLAWVGTPLANAAGFVGLIQRDVGELTTAGGTVNVSSGGSVIMQAGSKIDVSGGWINYAGGMVQTTRVMYGGYLFDISQATPDRVYSGVYTGQFTQSSSKWGVTSTYNVPFMLGAHFDPGYIYGMSGGSISITAPSAALDGTLSGNTLSGSRQLDVPATTSSLSLTFQAQMLVASNYPTYSPTPPTVVIQSGVTQTAADAFSLDSSGHPLALSTERQNKVVLSPALMSEDGFGSLSVTNVDGRIILPAGETLTAAAKGAVTLAGANIDILGCITVPGGSVTLNAYDLSPSVVTQLQLDQSASTPPPTPPPNLNRGNVTLGSNASISTAGLLVDDMLNGIAPLTQPHVTTGGSVNINAWSANLATGSVIDVSGGVQVNAFGKRTYGNAGGISIKAGADLSLPSVIGGHLTLGSTLEGLSGAIGGALTIQAQSIQIGGTTSNGNTLLLNPEFFNQGGFASFSLSGIGASGVGHSTIPGIAIAPGTVIAPTVTSLVAVLDGSGSGSVAMKEVLLPASLRTPVSLSFKALGVTDDFSHQLVIVGQTIEGSGASIQAGPLGRVSFKGDTVTLLGSVIASGGSISVSGAKVFPSDNPSQTEALTTVYIGPQASLSTAGTVEFTPDAYGRHTGYVLPGGNISVSGNIVAEAGAVLNVSGSSGSLDIAPAALGLATTLDPLTGAPVVPVSSGLTTPLYSRAVVRTQIDSSGGGIALTGTQELFTHATLLGNAGGVSATGGSLVISSGRFYAPGLVAPPSDINLDVTQSGSNLPALFFASAQQAIGQAVLDGTGHMLAPMGHFAVNDFERGGFDSLSLAGNVSFSGAVTVTARSGISVASGGFLTADGAVRLTASYVALGTAFQAPLLVTEVQNPFLLQGTPYYFKPTFGPGSLTVTAKLIDIGNLSLQNIGSASLIADQGDIRGDGTLDIAGSLYLRAGQVYPTTGSTFTIAAYDHTAGGVTTQGSVTITGSGTQSLPLSAGGTLNIFASNIIQGGVLRAPFGVINLGWDGTGTAPQDLIAGSTLALPTTQQITLKTGSVTSVSAIDPITGLGVIIPYGTSPNGTSWIDPAGNDITAAGLPQKLIHFSSKGIQTDAGSVIDIRGGGDLYAYRWVQGPGGSTDILASSTKFAVLPGYGQNYSPFGAFNPSSDAVNLAGDPGYLNSSLSVGDRVYLGGGSGLAAGVYTLLPARYALLPGAFLVTPSTGAPIGQFAQPDGSSFVNGYRYNDLNASRILPGIYSRFEIAPGEAVRARAEYSDFFANTFLTAYATKHNQAVVRLPQDSGQLVLGATTSLVLDGSVLSRSMDGGRGGLVDISSPQNILIASSELISQIGAAGISGTLILDSAQLSAFGAESLLIGGVRTVGPAGTTVAVQTGNLEVNNQGEALTGPEIILVANKKLTVDAFALIQQAGSLSEPAATLLLGSANTPGSGDGTLLRVSSDPGAQIIRAGVSSTPTSANMVIGAEAGISGTSVILDSTYASKLDSSASITGHSLSLDSGQISIQLANPGTLQPTRGLVLTGTALDGLQQASSLSLLSYSSIDVYGTGTVGASSLVNLSLHAGQIRGFSSASSSGNSATFSAQNILIDNSAGGSVIDTSPQPLKGTLAFDAQTLHLGVNQLNISRFANLVLNVSDGLYVQGSGGLTMQGSITASTPFIVASQSATQSITAVGGALTLNSTGGGSLAQVTTGLGASLKLQGTSVTANSDIILPSGEIAINATAGAVTIGGKLDVAGTAQHFYDLTKYTSGGSITLSSATSNVVVSAGGRLDVSAQSGGGNAGSLTVSASNGDFTLGGTLVGQAGSGASQGSFSLDVGALPALSGIETALNNAGFTQSQSFRVRTGDVTIDGQTTAHSFSLSADQGSIDVTGLINASGSTGGTISLVAFQGLTLASGSRLDASGAVFNSAGKGGAVTLETRGDGGAVIDIAAGSTINLSVAQTAGLGQFSGTLHLRAPQNSTASDLQISAIQGTIIGASSIVAEGYKVFDLTATSGAITSVVEGSVFANGTAFGANYGAITSRLLAGTTGLGSIFSVQVGAEIINTTGDLTLGTSTSTASADWDLSSYRFGPSSTPGVLTLRAAGNLVFYNTLSDGFSSSAYDATLLAPNHSLPANMQSWSYRLVAGADLSAADVSQVKAPDLTAVVNPLDPYAAPGGSLLLGKDDGIGIAIPYGGTALTSKAVSGFYQVIRTGSGDISIAARGDVQLLNQFATIYTAGTQVADPTLGGTFDTPVLNASGSQGAGLGLVQQPTPYPAQYTSAGGSVSISAQLDILHLTRNTAGVLIADSERELPINWLYRRGYVDPATGQFGKAQGGDVASTTWWVDFSNFFEGVGALGGGNVTMNAGRDIRNVDAAIPTNARMPKGTPNAGGMVELGGGDLRVNAGRNLDAGVYYVERGQGSLIAGGSITTNSTRSPSLTILSGAAPDAPETWLPTTLFLGKGSFDVSARGDVLVGPAANVFLLPEGFNNTYWDKTWFSTFASTDAVNVSSLGGTVTLRESATLPTLGSGSARPVLENWLQNVLLYNVSTPTASYYQPWLRLDETKVEPFLTTSSLMPGTLRVTAFAGAVNVIGNLNLTPSPTGTVDIAARGAINGLQISGVTTINGTLTNGWGSARINLSDADPAGLPGVASPFAYQSVTGLVPGIATTGDNFLLFIDNQFTESGSTLGVFGVLQTKQALHAQGVLHAADTSPVHLYAGTGDISGVTLFSSKAARIVAGRDITDIALYIQNTRASDVSVVASGRDLIAYDANSVLRNAARLAGNTLNQGEDLLAGDIQISGPGTLEVLAGRNLDLGVGLKNADGTGAGITSIGNGRNPSLPFAGAAIIAAAGVGPAFDLGSSALGFDAFTRLALAGADGVRYLNELPASFDVTGIASLADFNKLLPEEQKQVALDLFFLVLRDAGRDHNLAGSPGFGTYAAGLKAVQALFPGTGWTGEINTELRDIRTKSGGSITLLAPGGGLTLAQTVPDTNSNVPPPGIITETGGSISIFTHSNVDIGVSRIFTLRGGNEIIWSSAGNIAAGSSSKTVQSAPPTRVIIDPQSGNVTTDLAGLATGGGIGVLAAVTGVAPGSVDLIAPSGTIDAGDAGIRATGNLNIAAITVLNAGNISVGGISAGAPAAPAVAAPNIGGLTASSNTAAAATTGPAAQAAAGSKASTAQAGDVPSIISVEVIGYGGDDDGQTDEEKKRKKQAQGVQ